MACFAQLTAPCMGICVRPRSNVWEPARDGRDAVDANPYTPGNTDLSSFHLKARQWEVHARGLAMNLYHSE